jgi:PPP family 3-phenylpropionic acid transporter
MAQRRGTDFGFIRAWGTVGYTIATAMTGMAVGLISPQLFVPIFIGWGLLRIALSLPLPRFRAPTQVDAPVRKSGVKLSELLRPWFLLPCFAYALIQSTHFFLGAMGALVWKIDGVGEGWIGPLIAVSAVAEAIVMFAWRKVGGTMSARTMLIISCLVATARWTAMAFNPSLPMLFALQLLHGITLPFSYFGIMHFIANWAPEDIAAEAQGFSTALTMSALVLTLLGFGWLIGFLGGATYLVAAAMTIVAAAAVVVSLLLRPAHKRAEAV